MGWDGTETGGAYCVRKDFPAGHPLIEFKGRTRLHYIILAIMISVKFRAIPSAANDDYFREGLKDWP